MLKYPVNTKLAKKETIDQLIKIGILEVVDGKFRISMVIDKENIPSDHLDLREG